MRTAGIHQLFQFQTFPVGIAAGVEIMDVRARRKSMYRTGM